MTTPDGNTGKVLGAWQLGDLYSTAEARKFPLEALPQPVRDYVEQQAKALYVPVDFVAGPLLVALGGAIGRARKLQIKPGYKVNTALWLIVVGVSGTAKSPALQEATGFLHELEDSDNRIVISDITIEAIAQMMEQHQQGLVQVMDEMSAWAKRLNRYRPGSDEQDYLAMWSSGPITVDRKSLDKSSIRISDSYLSIVGTIQPMPMKNLFTRDRIESGLSARLLVCWPERIDRHYTEDTVASEIVENIQNLFKKLYNLSTLNCKNTKSTTPAILSIKTCNTIATEILTLSDGARKAWRKCAEANQAEINRGDMPEEFRAPWSKMESYAGRLILILHLVKRVLDLTGEKVEVDTVMEGWKLIGYFKAHAWKAYYELRSIAGPQDALSRLRNWISRHQELEQFALRDVLGAKIPGIDKAEIAKHLLNKLAEEGVGKWSEDGGKFMVNLNPAPSNPAK